MGFNHIFQRKWEYYLSICEAGFAKKSSGRYTGCLSQAGVIGFVFFPPELKLNAYDMVVINFKNKTQSEDSKKEAALIHTIVIIGSMRIRETLNGGSSGHDFLCKNYQTFESLDISSARERSISALLYAAKISLLESIPMIFPGLFLSTTGSCSMFLKPIFFNAVSRLS